MQSFPLNCSSWFWCHIIKDAVYALDLVYDAVCDVLQKLERNVLNCGGHCIFGVDGTDDYRPIPAALSIDYACGPVVWNDCEVLPDLACKTSLCKLLAKNCI